VSNPANRRRRVMRSGAPMRRSVNPDARVPGVREAIMLAEVNCPDDACNAPLTVAFPHPSQPDVLLTKCSACGHEWKMTPAAQA